MRANPNELLRWLGSIGCACAMLLPLSISFPAAAQNSLPTDPPVATPDDRTRAGDKAGQPASNEPELRKKAREIMTRVLDNRRRELGTLEKALRLIDEGKSLDEVHSLLPDLPRMGQRGEGREQWQRRMERWGGMSDTDGPEDENRRGGSGGMSQNMGAAPGGAGSGGKPSNPDAPRVLTEEDRVTVREILAATSPKTLKGLQDLEKTKPAEADKQYSRSLDRMRFLIDMRKRDPRMFELKAQDIKQGMEAGEIARAIGELDKSPTPPPNTEQRQQKVESLRATLLAQYHVRTQLMQRENDRAKDRAGEMARDIEKRPAQAAENVDKHVREMIEREHRRREKQTSEGEHRPNGKPGDNHSAEAPKRP